MGLATVHSRAQNGLQADPVAVEVDLSPGLPGLSIVGLPEAAVRESRDRVRAAILNSGYQFPNRRITINLAPADLPKEGGRFDLPIALGILAASDQIPAQALQDLEVLGELSLTGEIRPVRGVLPAAIKCSKMGRKLLVPEANVEEALLAGDCEVKTANQLGALCAILHGEGLASVPPRRRAASAPVVADLAEVRGQFQAKRALEIAAAGAHSLLMCGPPGAGKSMLAVRLPGILPPLEEAEAMEVAAVASISGGGFDPQDWGRRPYRAPHHTASGVALVGGGTQPRPGEITLAHHGVLFLDELARVRPACAGSAARAAGERPDHGVARGAAGGFSGALPAAGGDESLPLRLSGRQRRPLPLHAGPGDALSQPAVRAAARPHRSAGVRAAAGIGRADGGTRPGGGDQRHRTRAGDSGASPAAGARRQAQRRADAEGAGA
jgi:hypothetical protein